MSEHTQITPSRAPSQSGLGDRLRRIRVDRGLSLRELARRAGCSPSLLSQVERGQTTPSAGIVYSLANELGITLDSLFGATPASDGVRPARSTASEDAPAGSGRVETATAAMVRFPALPGSGEPMAHSGDERTNERMVVQRAGSRRRLELMTGVTWERLTPHADTRVDFLEVHYAPRAHSTESSNMIRHEGVEYLVVLEGEIHADVGFETYHLALGDSMGFESSTPHQYRNIADTPARVISFVVHGL